MDQINLSQIRNQPRKRGRPKSTIIQPQPCLRKKRDLESGDEQNSNGKMILDSITTEII